MESPYFWGVPKTPLFRLILKTPRFYYRCSRTIILFYQFIVHFSNYFNAFVEFSAITAFFTKKIIVSCFSSFTYRKICYNLTMTHSL